MDIKKDQGHFIVLKHELHYLSFTSLFQLKYEKCQSNVSDSLRAIFSQKTQKISATLEMRRLFAQTRVASAGQIFNIL